MDGWKRNTLRLLKRQFLLRFTADTVLPYFVGNTIRGAIGASFDRMGSSAYKQMFKVNSANSIPNPYTISVSYPSKGSYQKGDGMWFSVTLFGNACDLDGEVGKAVKNMCGGKLENCFLERDELLYDSVWSDGISGNIPHADCVTIHFLTPTEVVSSQKSVKEMDWNMFMDLLFGRICDVIGNYTDEEFVLPYALVARRPQVLAEYRLKAIRFQTNGQPIHGIMGSIRYTGDVTRYLPYIDLGSHLHIGKKTTRACGEYRYEIQEELW
jgi:hypothetical protein